MGLAELFAGIGEDNDVEEVTLTDDQIVTRLRDCVEHLDEAHTFRRGDIITHKFPSMATVKRAGPPMVFLRYLDEPIDMATRAMMERNAKELNASSAAACFYDMVGAEIHHGRFVKYLLNSQEYKPHPKFPRAD